MRDVFRNNRCRFLGVLVLLLLPLALAAASLTVERAADLAVADVRFFANPGTDVRLFLGEAQDFPEFIRLTLLQAGEKNDTPGTHFATYEISKADGKILRRDLAVAPAFPIAAPTVVDDRSGSLAIYGVLRNVPGYILQSSGFLANFRIWAEAQGRVVATETELLETMVYHLKNVPITAGTVVIKAKIRGYDLTTLHPGVTLNPSQPGGVIAGIDVDFHQITPLLRDVRLLVVNNGAGDAFPSGSRARVYVQETGQSVDVVSSNGMAEAVIPQVPTGWPLRFLAINLDAGNHAGELGPIIIPEDGGSMYTNIIKMQ